MSEHTEHLVQDFYKIVEDSEQIAYLNGYQHAEQTRPIRTLIPCLACLWAGLVLGALIANLLHIYT